MTSPATPAATVPAGRHVHRGALPADHPLVTQALHGTSITGREAAERLAADGETVWLSWYETVPAFGPATPAKPGRLIDAAWDQARAYDPKVGEQGGTGFKTARRHRLDLGGGHVLDVPIWRWGRRDLPHTPVCAELCAECGTGNYWLLPQYIWPPKTLGLADPENIDRVNPAEKTMLALGDRAVRLTDYARYSRGMTGHPDPERTGTVLDIKERAHRDWISVRWDDGSTEGMLRPEDITRP